MRDKPFLGGLDPFGDDFDPEEFDLDALLEEVANRGGPELPVLAEPEPCSMAELDQFADDSALLLVLEGIAAEIGRLKRSKAKPPTMRSVVARLEKENSVLEGVAEIVSRIGSPLVACNSGNVHVWIEWARESGAIRQLKGSLVPVTAWSRRGPFVRYQRALDKFLAIGPTQFSSMDETGRYEEIFDLMDDGTLPLLSSVWLRQNHPTTASELADRALQAATLSPFFTTPFEPGELVDASGQAFSSWLDALDFCGLVEPSLESEPESADSKRLMRLSVLGKHGLRDIFSEDGFHFRTPGAFVGRPFAALLAEAETLTPDAFIDEFRLVVEHVGTEKSVAEIIEFVEADNSPVTRSAISASLDSMGDGAMRDELRRGLLDSKLRGYVGGQLVQDGLLGAEEVGVEWLIRANMEMLWMQIEMEVSPAEVVVPELLGALPTDFVVEMLESIEEPWAAGLLQHLFEFVDASYKKKIRKILMKRV